MTSESIYEGTDQGRLTQTASGTVREPTQRAARLAESLVDLADNIVDDFDIVELFSSVADRCVDVLDVKAVGIMLAGPDDELSVMASSSENIRLLELLEVQSRQGPSLDCYRTGQVITNTDLVNADERWPTFAPEARNAGFAAVHAFPMRFRKSVIGAFNLFHDRPGLLSGPDTEAAQAFADIATMATLQHQGSRDGRVLIDQLNRALDSRTAVEQAKTIVSERRNLEVDAAFGLLRNHARNHNLRLTDLADSIISGLLLPAGVDEINAGF